MPKQGKRKSKTRKRGKKKHKPGRSSKKYEKYAVQGTSLTRNGRTCPKCGLGVHMAEHKDRYACGKCGFMEKK